MSSSIDIHLIANRIETRQNIAQSTICKSAEWNFVRKLDYPDGVITVLTGPEAPF